MSSDWLTAMYTIVMLNVWRHNVWYDFFHPRFDVITWTQKSYHTLWRHTNDDDIKEWERECETTQKMASSNMSYNILVVFLKAGFHLEKYKASDWTFFHLVLPGQKSWKHFKSLSSGMRITDLNWNRKLSPKAHARVQFCSDPVRCHAYFPEWKSAVSSAFRIGK